MKTSEYQKEYRKTKVDSYWTIYLLKNFDGEGNDYVGQTNSPFYRMHCHKRRGRDVSQMSVLATAETREKALEIERYYHSQGFKGKQGIRKGKRPMKRLKTF